MVSSILLAGPGVNQFFDSLRRTSARSNPLSEVGSPERDPMGRKDGALVREGSTAALQAGHFSLDLTNEQETSSNGT
jgi:hypothetical protein